jgi:hypothetical protein
MKQVNKLMLGITSLIGPQMRKECVGIKCSIFIPNYGKWAKSADGLPLV